MIGSYDTPQAFRAALEARLRNLAQREGTDLQRLQRRVAFERLLARLFVGDDPPWMLKGGYAMELRFPDRARSTVDLDLSMPEPSRLPLAASGIEADRVDVQVRKQLQVAAEHDLGDGFQFRVGAPRRPDLPGGGTRFPIEARLAGRVFARFHLDMGLGDVVLDPPEWVETSDLLEFAGIPAVQVALFPLAQHVAEKIHAYTFPWQDRGNTRVKDLVDLILLLPSEQLEPERIMQALAATFKARGTHPVPSELPVPPEDWAEPYAALAEELGLEARTLDEAYTYLARYWQRWNP